MPNLSALNKIAAIANKLAFGGEKMLPSELRTLLSYLKNEGMAPSLLDMHPGVEGVLTTPFQVPAPQIGEAWYRGAPVGAKLDAPIFTTRQKDGAAWFATERGRDGIGAVNSYEATPVKTARLRDLYRVGLENKLAPEMLEQQNPLDWTYNKDFRAALADRGYDSALASDPLMNDEIEALVALHPGILTPKTRSIVTYEDHPIFEQLGKEPKPFGETGYYHQFGEERPWSSKKQGGLVQYKECGC